MITALVFSDGHVAPGQPAERWSALGKFILDRKPTEIWNLGDMATNDSVTFWNVPHKDKVTLQDDVNAVVTAQELLFAPIEKYNKQRRKTRHKQYKPYTVLCKGNHEDRLDRRIENDELGLGSIVDPTKVYKFDKYWKEICDYGEYIERHGILLTHCPFNRLSRPMTGVNRGRQIAMQSPKPVFYGHTHMFEHTSVGMLGSGNAVNQVVNLPAFMEQGHVEKYAAKGASGWSYGFLYVTILDDGSFTYEWVSTAQLMAQYS